MYENFEKNKFIAMCKELSIPMDKKIKEFSTGMKRKLQILVAISHDSGWGDHFT